MKEFGFFVSPRVPFALQYSTKGRCGILLGHRECQWQVRIKHRQLFSS